MADLWSLRGQVYFRVSELHCTPTVPNKPLGGGTSVYKSVKWGGPA